MCGDMSVSVFFLFYFVHLKLTHTKHTQHVSGGQSYVIGEENTVRHHGDLFIAKKPLCLFKTNYITNYLVNFCTFFVKQFAYNFCRHAGGAWDMSCTFFFDWNCVTKWYVICFILPVLKQELLYSSSGTKTAKKKAEQEWPPYSYFA